MIHSSLDIIKATSPYSILPKPLKLLKNDISDQRGILFNLSFTTISFPTPLKTTKVILIYEKISVLSNVDKIFRKTHAY